MRKSSYAALLILFAIAICQTFVIAQNKRGKTIRRAKPPTFKESETKGIFFSNIFADGGLIGERPSDLGKPPTVSTPGSGSGTGTSSPPGGLHKWKDIIASAVIEDEIKRISTDLDKSITTPTSFQSRGYKQARKSFSMLSMLFAIVAEYDGDVRWKKDAAELRDLFARAAGGAKVGSQQAYDQAKKARDSLKDLVRGGAFVAAKKSDPKANWLLVVDRSPLMQRLEVAHQGNMQPIVSNASEFKAKKGQLVHEANLVAAISEVLTQDGMTDGNEDGYAAHAKNMKKAALDIIAAVKLDSLDNAASAVGAIGQACSKCHSDWR